MYLCMHNTSLSSSNKSKLINWSKFCLDRSKNYRLSHLKSLHFGAQILPSCLTYNLNIYLYIRHYVLIFTIIDYIKNILKYLMLILVPKFRPLAHTHHSAWSVFRDQLCDYSSIRKVSGGNWKFTRALVIISPRESSDVWASSSLFFQMRLEVQNQFLL